MADTPTEATAPRTRPACLTCRNRKLKCSKEDNCSNCQKADLPCVYLSAPVGVKRKRGPYKKDKPARERQLEHIVRTLGQQQQGLNHESSEDGDAGPSTPPDNDQLDVAPRPEEPSTFRGVDRRNAPEVEDTSIVPDTMVCPSKDLLKYWHLYTTRVDPITKILHCPSLFPSLCIAADNPSNLDAPTTILILSICHAATSSCTPEECLSLFSQPKQTLVTHYASRIETDITTLPSPRYFTALQALVLYIFSTRYQDHTPNLWILFTLALRSAQLQSLHLEPPASCPPLESELRKRLWWTLCSLEHRCAEAGFIAPSTSFALSQSSQLSFPASLNDTDLSPTAPVLPTPRTGMTDTAFMLARWELYYLNHRLSVFATQNAHLPAEIVKNQQLAMLEATTSALHTRFLQHCHPSRPYDLLALEICGLVTTKACLLIHHPNALHQPLDPASRLPVLRAALSILGASHTVATHPLVKDWHWYTRGIVQWHWLALLLVELANERVGGGISGDGARDQEERVFVSQAWGVLDPVLMEWDGRFAVRRGLAAWEHVGGLIARARVVRALREERLMGNGGTGLAAGMLAQPMGTWEAREGLGHGQVARGAQQDAEMAVLGDGSGGFKCGELDVSLEAFDSVFRSPSWECGLEDVDLGQESLGVMGNFVGG